MSHDHDHDPQPSQPSQPGNGTDPDNARAQRFWDGRAAAYDNDDDGQADPTLLGDIQRYLRPADHVLDLGCATGTYTLAVAPSVAVVEGRDLSSKMIALAQEKAAAQGVANARFAAGSLAEARYPERTFDVVLALNVLHLLPDAAETVGRIAAVLKPGGRLISETPCLGQKRTLVGLFLRGLSKVGVVPDLHALSSADIDALMAGAGLHQTEARLRPGAAPSYFLVATKP